MKSALPSEADNVVVSMNLQPPQPGSQDEINPARLTIRTWRVEIRDGHVFTAVARRSVPTNAATRSSTTGIKADRARRTLRGIDEQIAKAENGRWRERCR